MEEKAQNKQKPLAALQPSPVKCIVWDLDDTLWHGTLLENDEVRLRAGIADTIKLLDQRGILHSIASRNERELALAKLRQFGLSDYFLFPQIDWASKSESVRVIQQKLNIGLDTIAFIDDQPFEREEVAFVHPQVRCYDVPVLDELLLKSDFQPRFITTESSRRRLMYQEDARRDQLEKELNDNQEFLASLRLKFTITLATADDLHRVEELTLRTNQLNSTGYTYSYEELEALLDSKHHRILVAELEDKFGSYGKVGVALLETRAEEWVIKLLLMSCRVISRGVGTVLLHTLIEQAIGKKKTLYAEFMPTDRNRMMYITYKFSGFTEASSLVNGGQLLKCTGMNLPLRPAYLEVDTAIDLG